MRQETKTLRFGLAGTGYWARETHGPVLAREPSANFVAIWGRHTSEVEAIAQEFGVNAYTDFTRFLGSVDVVTFAVPPNVQSELAVCAAEAGKHLLLEKPMTVSVPTAEQLVAAVDRANVSTIVFFTARFSGLVRKWLSAVGKKQWDGAWARWMVPIFTTDNPYASSSWRRSKGALWDVGPHALALLTGALGTIVRVTADSGAGDLVHLVLHHAGSATSTLSLTLGASQLASNRELTLWGRSGVSTMPPDNLAPQDAFATAVNELISSIRVGQRRHPCSVHFGAEIVRVLADAERDIDLRSKSVETGSRGES